MTYTIKKETLIFFCFIVCVLKISAIPFKNTTPHRFGNRNVSRPDMTTEYAKSILRLSKAAEINSNLNLAIDPCTDFYQYSCGNWHHGYPAQLVGEIVTDRFSQIAKAFDRRLRNLIEEPEDDNDIGNKVKIFYRACKIARQDELQYKLSMQNIFKEFGNFTGLVGEDWDSTDFNWWETVARIQHKYGKEIFFSVDIMADVKNKKETRIYLGPPEYETTVKTKFVDLLLHTQVALELKAQFDIDDKTARKYAKKFMTFENTLSQSGTDSRLGWDFQEMLDFQNLETLSDTYKEYFDIKRYLELVLGQQPPENIYVYDDDYIDNALHIIDKTPKHIVANYILWKLLKIFAIQTEEDMSTFCLDTTKTHFGKYIDNWVYSRYRDEKEEADVIAVFEDLRTSFREALSGNKLDWISNNTREYAIVKLDALKLVINSYDNENFTYQYGKLKLDPYSHIKNMQNVLMQNSENELKKINETNVGETDDAAVMSFTPTYNILANNIKIPVAFLQPRHFWSNDYPKAIKFATMGYLIAHEIIHAFDDEGRKFSKDGNAYTWWDSKSTYEFEERRKCFQAQYHSYKFGGKALPERVAQSENIADNAGVKLAYQAYQHWLKSQEENDPDIESKEVLPGLSLNNRQLFFVSFAQVWCEDVQTFFKSTVAMTDDHAPGKYRVIGSLSNFQEFSWVFKCAQDAPMDPEYKCSIY